MTGSHQSSLTPRSSRVYVTLTQTSSCEGRHPEQLLSWPTCSSSLVVVRLDRRTRIVFSSPSPWANGWTRTDGKGRFHGGTSSWHLPSHVSVHNYWKTAAGPPFPFSSIGIV